MQQAQDKILNVMCQKRLKALRKAIIVELAKLKRKYFYCESCDDYHFPDEEDTKSWEAYNNELKPLLTYKKKVVSRIKTLK